MPIKFKPSITKKARGETKSITTHYYITNISQEELFMTLNKSITTPKRKQKIRTELARRGVNIISKTIDI